MEGFESRKLVGMVRGLLVSAWRIHSSWLQMCYNYTLWDVVTHCWSRSLSTGGSWVRIPL